MSSPVKYQGSTRGCFAGVMNSHAHVLRHSKTVLALLGSQVSTSAWSSPLGSPAEDGSGIERFLPHLLRWLRLHARRC